MYRSREHRKIFYIYLRASRHLSSVRERRYIDGAGTRGYEKHCLDKAVVRETGWRKREGGGVVGCRKKRNSLVVVYPYSLRLQNPVYSQARASAIYSAGISYGGS